MGGDVTGSAKEMKLLGTEGALACQCLATSEDQAVEGKMGTEVSQTPASNT